ncbi:MAG: hypothetical protein WKF77_20825 [Planctomycetaceae bacterium]
MIIQTSSMQREISGHWVDADHVVLVDASIPRSMSACSEPEEQFTWILRLPCLVRFVIVAVVPMVLRVSITLPVLMEAATDASSESVDL